LDNLRVKSPATATNRVSAPPPPAAQGEGDGGPTSPVHPESRVDSLSATAPGLRISLAPAEEREKRNAIDAVQLCVAEEFNLQPADLRSHATARSAAFPCQVAMYLAKRVSGASLREIGRAFGGKHHSTVLYAVNKIEGLSAGAAAAPPFGFRKPSSPGVLAARGSAPPARRITAAHAHNLLRSGRLGGRMVPHSQPSACTERGPAGRGSPCASATLGSPQQGKSA
jgi:hypothetical protein